VCTRDKWHGNIEAGENTGTQNILVTKLVDKDRDNGIPLHGGDN